MPQRRAKGSGSIRLRPDGRYEGRIKVGGQLQSVYGRTESEVEAELGKLRIADGIPATELSQTADEDPLLADFLVEWLADRKPYIRSPRTYMGYRDIVLKHLVPGLGAYRLTKITPKHVEAYTSQKLKWGLSPRTVHHHRAVLRNALNYALRHSMVYRNVVALSESLPVESVEIAPLTPEETRRFLDAVRGDSVGPVYIIAATCGLRSSEVLGLAWRDVNLEEGTLTVRQTLIRVDGEYLLRERRKTLKSRRTVGLPQLSLEVLQEWREKQKPESPDDLVFHGPREGKPINSSWLTHHLHRALKKAGLPDQTTHGLRHLAASLMLASGLSLNEVARTLGHSQISLTANLYGHWYDEGRQKVVRHMDRILGQDSGSDSGSTRGSLEGPTSDSDQLRA